ncbi:MAG TPA: N-acetylmuramoyl-L-alanine amidase [Candidatus Mediterraneibacter norfolkensis]|nr:N-acetylmuramoyl-L-alanine amidase [Candidatus Mediterraneibacter norfolkensis]
MSYTLVKNLTTVNYTKGNSGRKYIVIHYTGNKTDTAANNANYFKSTNRGASAHYFVDKTQVVQVVDDANTSWAVGVNYGSNNLFGKCTNANSISIEMCSDGGKIADATYKNTVELTKSLMKKYNIPASNVVRHWDVCSKACPGWTGWGANGKDASIWNQFKKDIGGTASTSTSTSSSSSSTSKPSSSSSSKPTITFKYRVKAGGKWYPEVKNLNDYAGVRGKSITDIAIGVDRGSVWYQVHIKGGGWLPKVTGYNINDAKNGYAGNGKVIDAVRVYYNTPSDYANKYGYQKAQYRVSPVNGNYYSWQYDNETGGGQDGYAGTFGKAIDRFQIF